MATTLTDKPKASRETLIVSRHGDDVVLIFKDLGEFCFSAQQAHMLAMSLAFVADSIEPYDPTMMSFSREKIN